MPGRFICQRVLLALPFGPYRSRKLRREIAIDAAHKNERAVAISSQTHGQGLALYRFTGDIGSSGNAITSFCASPGMPCWPNRGMFAVDIVNEPQVRILIHGPKRLRDDIGRRRSDLPSKSA
jgi:hypothetical protein